MTATITDITVRKPNRRPDAIPAFPGSDCISDPYPSFLATPGQAALFFQILDEELVLRGLQPLSAVRSGLAAVQDASAAQILSAALP